MCNCALAFATATLVVLAGAACEDTLDVPDSDFAVLTVAASAQGAAYTTRPSGLFFRSSGILLPTGSVGRDSCETQVYPGDATVPTLDFLDAGPTVTARVSGQTGVLVPTTQNGIQSYAMVPGSSITYTPGDTMEFEIPGASDGFAGLTVRAKTAEAFVLQAMAIDRNATSVDIDWTPATPRAGAAMFYEFRYASGSAVLNRELACFFVDDGSAELHPDDLRQFNESTIRETRATRIRISANRTGETVSHVTSTFSAPVTVTVTP